jgi:hypothetical protein
MKSTPLSSLGRLAAQGHAANHAFPIGYTAAPAPAISWAPLSFGVVPAYHMRTMTR